MQILVDFVCAQNLHFTCKHFLLVLTIPPVTSLPCRVLWAAASTVCSENGHGPALVLLSVSAFH